MHHASWPGGFPTNRFITLKFAAGRRARSIRNQDSTDIPLFLGSESYFNLLGDLVNT